MFLWIGGVLKYQFVRPAVVGSGLAKALARHRTVGCDEFQHQMGARLFTLEKCINLPRTAHVVAGAAAKGCGRLTATV